LGCNDTAAYPVISHSQAESCSIRSRYPAASSTGANGWMPANSGQVTASISVVALSFIVHEPSGIIDRSRARSMSESRRR
jgi:hypothetical protein